MKSWGGKEEDQTSGRVAATEEITVTSARTGRSSSPTSPVGARRLTSSDQPYSASLSMQGEKNSTCVIPESDSLATKTKAVLAREIVETIKSRNGRFLQRVLPINSVSSRRDRLVDGQNDRSSHVNMRRRPHYA
jgi:hypothetical protein